MTSGKLPALSVFICQPLFDAINKQSTFGPFVRDIDLKLVSALLYAIGAAIGHDCRNKLDTLEKLLFVPDSDERERNRIMNLCKEDARKNLKKFIRKYGQEPSTFWDFIFFNGLEDMLDNKAVKLSPQEAFEAYFSGDGKVEKLFDAQADNERIRNYLITMLLHGIQFGSSFPELTEKMFENHCRAGVESLPVIWKDLDVPMELRAKSLEETAKAWKKIVAQYITKYYPDRVDYISILTGLENK
jgi:hypothetical protein